MTWLITKYFTTAALIVLVSEIAKRTEKVGALLSALPMVVVLAMIWQHVEGQPPEKIASYATYTFWYVIPTLPMFLVFPAMQAKFGFWIAMIAGAGLTAICFVLLASVQRQFGVDLM